MTTHSNEFQDPVQQHSQAEAPLSAHELNERGKSLRDAHPRSTLGTGLNADRDPVALLDAQNAARVQELVPVRWGRMSQSPFAFYRGAAALMAHDLAPTPVSGIRVQACGDAHLSNFGFFGSPEGELVFDVNDFDETNPAPWEWDVERLVASFAVAACSQDFGDDTARDVAREAAVAYRKAMKDLAETGAMDSFHAVVRADDLLQKVQDQDEKDASKELSQDIKSARKHTSETALKKLATTDDDGELRLVEQPPLMVRPAHLPEDMTVVPQLYGSSVTPDIAALLRRFRPVDGMFRVVGVGSVGTRCLIELMVDSTGAPLILQIKEATSSVLEDAAGASKYEHPGERVVAGQRIMQAVSDPFLGWTTSEGKYYYVRQFRDQKGSVEVERLSAELLGEYAALCGAVLARAHVQSTEPALIAGYLGGGREFEDAMTDFALAYSHQNDADYQRLLDAIDSGKIQADTEA